MNLNDIRVANEFLNSRDKFKIYSACLIQSILNLLDLIGIAIIGILISITITGIQSKVPGDRISRILSIVHIDDWSLEGQAFILGSFAIVFFFLKSFFNIVINKYLLQNLANVASEVSEDYVRKIFKMSYSKLSSRSPFQYQYDIITGINSLIVDTLGSAILLFTDLNLIIILSLAMLFIDPLVAVFSLFSFGVVALIMYKILGNKSREVGYKFTEKSLETSEAIKTTLTIFQEAELRGTKEFFLKRITKSRSELAEFAWKVNFYPSISKYIFESALIVFTVILAGIQFILKDSVQALSIIAIFLASSSRIAPAILRMQQSATIIKASSGRSSSTVEFFKFLDTQKQAPYSLNDIKTLDNVKTLIKCEKVFFSYSSDKNHSLSDVSFDIHPGKFIAFVGQSGAGKTTLINLIMGQDLPSQGNISIGDLSPREFALRYPGAIAFVPQEVRLVTGTLLENILLGEPENEFNRAKCDELLRLVHLGSFLDELPNGLEQKITSFGQEMSGGQKQRIGICRALFTDPKILFLDEATSALDSETENSIGSLLKSLHGKVTLVAIAHRLSTIREADEVMYFSGGSLKERGSFEDLRKSLPEFDNQAKMLGLG